MRLSVYSLQCLLIFTTTLRWLRLVWLCRPAAFCPLPVSPPTKSKLMRYSHSLRISHSPTKCMRLARGQKQEQGSRQGVRSLIISSFYICLSCSAAGTGRRIMPRAQTPFRNTKQQQQQHITSHSSSNIMSSSIINTPAAAQ